MRKIVQKELAKKVGVSEAHLSRVLHFKKLPRVDLAMRIARELDETVESIWGHCADRRQKAS